MSSGYPQTNSTLALPSGQNLTSTAISTNILITVRSGKHYIPVGAVQSMAISEKRNIKMVDEVGTDGHIDSVPNQSANFTGTCQRVRFDKLRVAEAFDRGFMHVQSQIYPFDIVIFDKQKYKTGSQITTVIKNVWINGIDYTYQVTDWVITDSMTWEAETIMSTLSGTNNPAAIGGQLGLQPFGINNPNWIERQADSGANGRRGSLDAAGLIDIGTIYPGTASIF